MNEKKSQKLTFNSHYVETVEISPEIASDCKLRSKFVHEKIIEARNKEAAFAVTLLIYEEGVRVVRPLDQIVLSSHSIQRISYSACDRVSNLFALVVRCIEIDRSQICFIFRMNTLEQAESVNRYFGTVFKHLHNRKKEKRYKCAQNSKQCDIVTEFSSSPRMKEADSNFEDIDLPLMISTAELVASSDRRCRPNQISTSDDVVALTHQHRRLSLSMPSTECDDGEDVDDGDQLHPLNSSLEARDSPGDGEKVMRPFVRRKKPEYKGNRISQVIERLSFRGTREGSSDILKSGSPVVALKEQIEYEELLSAASSLGSDGRQEGANCVSRVKPLPPSSSNLCINNDSIAVATVPACVAQKNSAIDDSEEPPVPPMRIHSLRTTVIVPVRDPSDSLSPIMAEYDDNDDFSSVTTPSPRDPVMGHGPVKFSVSGDEEVESEWRGVSGPCPSSQYFMDLNKEQAMDCLLARELGDFLLRPSGSHLGCMALSVKVGPTVVSHYIIEPPTGRQSGYRMKGLDKTWPDLQALVTHLSVMPEILPCPISVNVRSRLVVLASVPPRSKSAHDEYQHRMEHFLADVAAVSVARVPGGHDQYQQLSEFSSLVAGLDT